MYSKFMFGATVVLTVGTLVAAPTATTFNKAAEWRGGSVANAKEGFSIKGKGCVLAEGTKAIKIDAKKTYRISFSAKAEGLKGKDTCWVLGGFRLYDQKGSEISQWTVAIVPNSQTEVAVNAKKGDNFILLKDLSKIKAVYAHYSLVGGAKKDLSDLPNRNLITGNLKSLAKDGQYYKLTFARPLTKDVAAGTSVRLQYGGSYMYSAGNKYIKDQWVKFSGMVKGINMNGSWSYSQWPRGTVTVKPIILSNWNRKATAVQYKDFVVTEE